VWVRSLFPKPTAVMGREPEYVLSGHSGVVHCVAFSIDSTRLASCSSDRSVRIWDTRSGKTLLQIDDPDQETKFLAISSDGTKLAMGANIRHHARITVWDLNNNKVIWTGLSENENMSALGFLYGDTSVVAQLHDERDRSSPLPPGGFSSHSRALELPNS
jgi:WD40 repeat protein